MENKKKLPLKFIFVAAAMFVVLAFSMALTTTSSAQQAATATPTATESPTATSSPATGATATPGATGTTGTIPVTGANAAPNTARALAFAKAVTRLSNVSDNNLEDRYNELLAKLRREERMLNSMNNKLSQFTKQLGKNAFNSNNAQNQNDLNASNTRNKHLQSIQQEFLTLSRNVAIARQQVLFAQIALNSRASFNADGNLNNRQAAINALAIAEISLDRGMAALRQFNNIAEAQ